MRRGRRKKFKLKFDLKLDAAKSVFALGLFLLWLVSFVSFFLPDYALNEKIHEFWRRLFGDVAFFAPMLLLIPALFMVDSVKSRFKEPRVIAGLTMMYITIVAFAHILVPASEAYEVAKDGDGGGMVGYTISSLLVRAVSMYGAVPIIFGLFLVSSLVLFNLSFDQIYQWLGGAVKSLGILNGFSKAKTKKERIDENSMEVNPEKESESEDEEAPQYVEKVKEPQKERLEESDQDFAFEVVPSLSEPDINDPILGESAVSTLIAGGVQPSLPYTDKVWQAPPLDILADYEITSGDGGDIETRKRKIVETLRSFGIEVLVEDTKCGPSVTQYRLRAESGVKVARIASLQNDLAMALASPTGSVRIEAPIPGKSLIGIEVPNNSRAIVGLKSLLMSEAMKGMKSKLGITLGKDVAGKVYAYDIGKMPHMLIAGTTGSGKSIFIHNILFSIMYRASPQEVRFILVDPKRVELTHYQDTPHLLTPVVTDMGQAPAVFNWAVSEMERRYKLFELARVRNIEGYNEKSGFQALAYIVIIVEELGEIMQVDPQGVEKSIIRIAQLARATGIHLVLSIQRPSTNVVTGLIKANIPCRIAFNVMSQIDSRVIIDQPGAEKLLGKGDMLFIPPDASKPTRLQAAMVTDKEIANLVEHIKSQGMPVEYNKEVLEPQGRPQNVKTEFGGDVDALFEDAVQIVTLAGKASASLLQRKLSIGYARAARILDELEQNGIVGPGEGSKPRDVLAAAGSSRGVTEFGPAQTSFSPRHSEPDIEDLEDNNEVNSIQV